MRKNSRAQLLYFHFVFLTERSGMGYQLPSNKRRLRASSTGANLPLRPGNTASTLRRPEPGDKVEIRWCLAHKGNFFFVSLYCIRPFLIMTRMYIHGRFNRFYGWVPPAHKGIEIADTSGGRTGVEWQEEACPQTPQA